MKTTLFYFLMLCATFQDVYAQEETIKGTSTGNSGIPLEFLFGGVRAQAATLVEKADFLPLDLKKDVDLFIHNNYVELSKDIARSPHHWIRNPDEEKGSCAWTKPESLSVIIFSPERCKAEGFVFLGNIEEKDRDNLISALLNQVSAADSALNKLLERERTFAIKTLIHESVHHVRKTEHKADKADIEEAFANEVANRIWDLWYPPEQQAKNASLNLSLVKGFYESDNPNWTLPRMNYDVKLAPWIEGGFVFERVHSAQGLFFYGDYSYNRYLDGVRLENVPGLPQNVYLFETKLAAHWAGWCQFDYKIKVIAVSESEFYVSEYFPESIGGVNVKPCTVSGSRWHPHTESYKRIRRLNYTVKREASPSNHTTLDVYFPEGSELYADNKKVTLNAGQTSVRLTFGQDALIKAYAIKVTPPRDAQWHTTNHSLDLERGQITKLTFSR